MEIRSMTTAKRTAELSVPFVCFLFFPLTSHQQMLGESRITHSSGAAQGKASSALPVQEGKSISAHKSQAWWPHTYDSSFNSSPS